MTTYEAQDIPRAEIHHDDDTETIAVTFRWRRPWAMDKCEVGCLVGDLTRTVVDRYRDWEQLAALEHVRCWDPAEEVLLGSFSTDRPILFPSGEPEWTERDKELALARRELLASIHSATYAAHGGEFGSLPMLADAAHGIIAALDIICPRQEGDSPEWTAIDRKLQLMDAIESAHRAYVWTADTLNAACASALRITRGWDRRRQEFT